MRESYQQFVKHASSELCEAIFTHELDLAKRARLVDGDVREILREVELQTMSKIFSRLSLELEREAKAEGMQMHSRTVITFHVLFGPVEIDSPYLWEKGRSVKPVKDLLGLWHQGRSEPLERALTDFGIEESFGQAASRFEEHYGWPVAKSTVRRVTESVALQAHHHVCDRLKTDRADFAIPLSVRPGVKRLLVELDGCDIRMGEFVRDGTGTLHRQVQWHEVRIGLAADLAGEDKRYVGHMGTYPEVVDQLFSLAVGQGLSKRTQVIAVAHGAKGLKEELEARFSKCRFILDRPHLKSHLYEGADALECKDRSQRVEAKLALIDSGHADTALEEVSKEYAKTQVDRLRQLAGYLERFQDCMDYKNFKERGFPSIGSGAIESAHRYVPQKRLKIAGACWHPSIINPMLSLRILRANRWWSHFWRERPVKEAA